MLAAASLDGPVVADAAHKRRVASAAPSRAHLGTTPVVEAPATHDAGPPSTQRHPDPLPTPLLVPRRVSSASNSNYMSRRRSSGSLGGSSCFSLACGQREVDGLLAEFGAQAEAHLDACVEQHWVTSNHTPHRLSVAQNVWYSEQVRG